MACSRAPSARPLADDVSAGDADLTAMTLEVTSAASDALELELLCSQLRRELLHLDVGEVKALSEGEAPAGSKGLDLAAVGTLLVHLASTPAALTSVINVVRSWLGRQGNRTVKLAIAGDSIELSGLSSVDQHRLIEQWIDSHAGR
ncbi:MAG: hypothetical protein M3083_01185 [Actinomycetota bacterium]|nr:hypothetical protein [Actinomycetota bacterium]